MRGVPICARMVRPRDKVEDLARAHGYGKVRRDFSRADPVAETAFHERHAGSDGVLQELPDLSVVYEGRDAHQKTSWGGSFLGRSFLRRASGSRRASREESAARRAPSQRERPLSLRTPEGHARISSACPRRRNTGLAVPHPCLRRDRRSSLRRSLSTGTPGSPFPARPSRRSYVGVHGASRHFETFSFKLLDRDLYANI